MLRRSWVEINTDTIKRNYSIYKTLTAPGQKIMAVIKADAYGHGDIRTARLVQEAGCTDFAVSNIEEAMVLRRAGITGQILILGYTPFSAIDELKEYDITQALLSEEYASQFAGHGIKAQFAIDTGMNRIGLDGSDIEACERTIRSYKNSFELTGLFTHLCVADTKEGDAFSAGQIERFKSVAERVSDLRLPYIHCMNSAGGMRMPPYGNLVRLGIIMYGLKPDPSLHLPAGIKPALSWKSVISMIKNVRTGETIGYGRTFTAPRDMRIATIPTGYADGYSRALSNKGHVIIRGKQAPITGLVCMDQMMVDISDIPDARYEDEATLLGEGYDANDMALSAGKICYEIICDISKRVPRLYINDKNEKQ